MSNSGPLGNGHIALVTGASRGIGPLIAREIARHGGHVVLTGRSAPDLKTVTAELAATGADVSFIPADLAEAAADLFANGDRSLVRNCEGPACTLWFYDRTKAHRRRWCSMAICGNRAKAHAHRARLTGRG